MATSLMKKKEKIRLDRSHIAYMKAFIAEVKKMRWISVRGECEVK